MQKAGKFLQKAGGHGDGPTVEWAQLRRTPLCHLLGRLATKKVFLFLQQATTATTPVFGKVVLPDGRRQSRLHVSPLPQTVLWGTDAQRRSKQASRGKHTRGIQRAFEVWVL